MSPALRYRAVKYLIVGLPLLYGFMILVTPIYGGNLNEIYPFFRWLLFSKTPGWIKTMPGVAVDAVDGAPLAEGPRFLVPSRDIRHMKTLKRVVRVCENDESGGACDEEVTKALYPIVRRETRGDNFDFMLVRIVVDLRDVRDDIWNLSGKRPRYSGHYRVDRVLSRWTVDGGTVARAGEPRMGEREP